jgi:hypothetical protein
LEAVAALGAVLARKTAVAQTSSSSNSRWLETGRESLLR